MLKSKPSKLYLIDLSDTIPEGEVLFELLLDTVFDITFRGQTFQILIPKGFKTNFASVPKKFRNVISNVGKYNKDYLVHDWLYNKYVDVKLFGKSFTKSDADVLLREMLKFDGMGLVDRNLVYYSVKWFGKEYWKRD